MNSENRPKLSAVSECYRRGKTSMDEERETKIKRFHGSGKKQINFAADGENVAISIQAPSEDVWDRWPVITLDKWQVQKLIEWLQEQANG